MTKGVVGADAPEESLAGRAAAVRRSARISSQCSSDASDSGSHRLRARRPAWLQEAQRIQAEAKAELRQSAEKGLASDKPQASKHKRSRLAVSLPWQSSPVDALPSKRKTGATAAREAKRRAGAEGPHKVARRRGVQTKPTSNRAAPQQQKSVNTAERTDEGLQESRSTDGLAPQMPPAEHAQKMTKPVKAQPAAQPAGISGLKVLANAEQRNGNSSARQLLAKQTEEQHSKPVEEAVTCLQAASAINAEAAAGGGPSSKRSPGSAGFPIKDWDSIYEKLRQNSSQYKASQAASQSPHKTHDLKGKGKMRASEELRDPEQPGPSNAAYRLMQAPTAFDSDDDSLGLETPLF